VRPLVLCYHLVSPTWEHRLSIEPELLLRQVRALSRFKRVRVTFDDGFRSAASVFPALRDLGIPIQLFVCTAYARTGASFAIPELAGDDAEQLRTMTWDELRGHAESGITISPHTVTHPHLTTLSDSELRLELTESKAELEAELGAASTEFAYPYGEHDDRVRAAVRSAGYERAYAVEDGSDSDDPYALPRLDLYSRHTPTGAVLLLTPFRRFVA
jgi:peptidoglycan/xylan/chitin deacetylase (PgdA/CDA1 family)